MTSNATREGGKPLKIGLTGSIAMGKSTTAQMFRDAGAAVHDSDAAVHRVYSAGGSAGPALKPLAADAVRDDGSVDRDVLKARIAADPTLLAKIEAAVHPLLGADRKQFEEEARQVGADVWVYDVPLLFETDGASRYDAVVVVSAAADVQRQRALERPGMTEDHLDRILARQTPDAEKRQRADFIVETDKGLEQARAQVNEIMTALRKRISNIAGANDDA